MTHFTILQHKHSFRYEVTPTQFVRDYSLDFWDVVWEGEAESRNAAMLKHGQQKRNAK